MNTDSSSGMHANVGADGSTAEGARRSSKETAASVARVIAGILAVIALAEVVGSFAALEEEGNSCSLALSLVLDDSSCNWSTVLGYAGMMGAVVALTIPVAALGVMGMRGARTIVASAPFTILAVLGIGLLVLNLGPLAALLTHENSAGFLISVAMLVVGVPPTVVFARKLLSMRKERASESVGDTAKQRGSQSA